MIDSSLWEILISFHQLGTLSAVAEKMYVSQPSLSTAMRRLEKELGITLFDRSRNRLALNEIGLEAVSLATKLLESEKAMIHQLQEMNRRLNAIIVASYCSGLRKMLIDRLSVMYPERSILSEHLPSELLPRGLLDERYDYILTEYEIDEPGVACVPYTTDRLLIRLHKDDPLFDRESVTLQDLRGSKLLVWTQSGFWASFIRRRLQDKLELVFVNDEQEYHALIHAFHMRSFILETAVASITQQSDYRCIPLTEEGMQVSFFLCCQQKNSALLPKLLPKK